MAARAAGLAGGWLAGWLGGWVLGAGCLVTGLPWLLVLAAKAGWLGGLVSWWLGWAVGGRRPGWLVRWLATIIRNVYYMHDCILAGWMDGWMLYAFFVLFIQRCILYA